MKGAGIGHWTAVVSGVIDTLLSKLIISRCTVNARPDMVHSALHIPIVFTIDFRECSYNPIL